MPSPASPTDPSKKVTVPRKRLRTRAAAAGVGLGLVLGSFALAGPAAAETTDPAPSDVRSERDERPVHDLEVLRLRCEAADGDATDTRITIGCRWREAQSERAAGYQLWRIVDRGHRELVARGGLDMLGHRDVVAADSHLVRYAVIAVDENGRRVGQSRVERVELGDDDRPVRRHRWVSQR